jgi:hypothetical protein
VFGEITEGLRRFVADHIRSIEQLEVLLLLNGSPDRAWSPADVYRSVLTNERSVQQTLDYLCERHLVERHSTSPSTYQFAPPSESTKAILTELTRLYKERPVTFVQLLYAPPEQEIEAFAKAFRIRKDR